MRGVKHVEASVKRIFICTLIKSNVLGVIRDVDGILIMSACNFPFIIYSAH